MLTTKEFILVETVRAFQQIMSLEESIWGIRDELEEELVKYSEMLHYERPEKARELAKLILEIADRGYVPDN